jgi:dihydrofolate synthase / folylpolyglutamate synthase
MSKYDEVDFDSPIDESTYNNTVNYLFGKLPYFNRDGKTAIKKSLDNIINLCRELGNPQDQFKSIHIAGTNGKGSVCHSLSAIFQQHGFKTGLYTSPHLIDITERCRIDGIPAPKSFIVHFVACHKSIIESVQPSFFELTCAMAFEWFALQKVDIAVIETGLGGRLDSTNIIKPVLSIITNISYDHCDLLGNTLQEIASEKAGIIKCNTPVLIGRKQPEISDVFRLHAKMQDAPIFFSEHFHFDIHSYNYDLKGRCQNENLQTVLSSIHLLGQLGFSVDIQSDQTRYALSHVTNISGLRGRWEVIQSHNPFILADTAHNEDGVQQLIEQVLSLPHLRVHIVWGMMHDKDRTNIWKCMPPNATYYFAKPDVPRGMDATLLLEEAKAYNLNGRSYDSVTEAYHDACSNADANDVILIGGSTFVVADLLRYLDSLDHKA